MDYKNTVDDVSILINSIDDVFKDYTDDDRYDIYIKQKKSGESQGNYYIYWKGQGIIWKSAVRGFFRKFPTEFILFYFY